MQHTLWIKCLYFIYSHVIRYDADSIVLYLTVKIPPSIWEEMQPYHRQSVDALAGCTVKISKARDTAPCLVQCKLYTFKMQ